MLTPAYLLFFCVFLPKMLDLPPSGRCMDIL